MSQFFSTMALGWGKVWPILFAIVFFGFIIASHELGHFAFAKLFGVRVNQFAIGMGPAIWKKQKGETEYSLRLLPIGGFCAMEGEDGDSEDDRAFFKKKVWQRMIIVAAGAVVNLILADRRDQRPTRFFAVRYRFPARARQGQQCRFHRQARRQKS